MGLRRHGADLHGVPVDDGGIVIEAVREKLELLKAQNRRCKLIDTMPTFLNPAGPTATLERRQALIALAREHETPILEDDAYGDLRFKGEFIPSLYALDDGGIVIRSGTFSKILGAGMRLGWLLAPQEMIPTLQGFNFGGGVAPFTSRVATYYMREQMADHVKVLIDVYRNKRDAMLQGLYETLEGTDAAISKPAGGFFIWIKLPTGTDTGKLFALASGAGIRYVTGNAFMPNGGGEGHIRLAFSYESEEKCHVGARHVVITDVNEYRLDLARQLGVTHALNVCHKSIAGVQRELGMREGFDVGLEMSGNAAALRDMLANMAHGGRIALLGIPPTEFAIDWHTVVFNMLALKGIYGREMYETWYMMTVLLQSGLDIAPVITHRLPFADYEEAFAIASSGQAGKVVLRWAEE